MGLNLWVIGVGDLLGGGGAVGQLRKLSTKSGNKIPKQN